MTPAGLSEEEKGRFIEAVERLARSRQGRFGVAFSGGPDSLALLLLAAAAFPGRVEAATVDHGLRPESKAEAARAADQCAALDLPHEILFPSAPISGNIQSAARQARYQRLEEWRLRRGLDWLLTAHHADDQAETLVMRLNRSSGLAGLSGIRARNGAVLRPLLGWRHETLVRIADRAPFPPVDDPSNRDPAYDRARLRAALGQADWIDPLAWARSAAALGEAEQALDWAAAALEDRISGDLPLLFLDPAGLPAELKRRLLLRVVARIDPQAAPRGETLARLIAMLEQGGTATLGKVKASGGACWRFEVAAPRRGG